jgi:hypothetical protein
MRRAGPTAILSPSMEEARVNPIADLIGRHQMCDRRAG